MSQMNKATIVIMSKVSPVAITPCQNPNSVSLITKNKP